MPAAGGVQLRRVPVTGGVQLCRVSAAGGVQLRHVFTPVGCSSASCLLSMAVRSPWATARVLALTDVIWLLRTL